MAATARCSRCGAANRIDAAKLRQGLRAVCGRCGAVLPSGQSKVVEVDAARFDEDVLGSPIPVLLDVWAPWCVPCRGLEPVIEDLANALAGRVRVVKLNADLSPDVVSRLQIQGIPTLILFRDGREVTRMVGARGKAEILRAVAPDA